MIHPRFASGDIGRRYYPAIISEVPLARTASDDPPPGPSDLPPRIASLPGGSVNVQLLILALPILGEQLGNFLVGFVDTFLAGHVSKEATAAVGIGAYTGWFVSLAFSLVGTGTTALVARSFGRGDTRTANEVLHQSLLLGLVLGLALSCLVYAGAPRFAAFLSRTDEAQALITHYIRIDALGYWVFCLYVIAGSALRAAGDMRTPMLVMLALNVVNAGVSATLVFGWLGLPEMGVTGIAIGTVVARYFGALVMLLVLLRELRGLRIRASLLRWKGDMIARILRIGVPAAGDAGVMWLAQVIFIWCVAESAIGVVSTAQVAAHVIAIRMEAISFLPAVAWMTAATTAVGQYLGAGHPHWAERFGHRAALQAGMVTSLVGVGFWFGADWIYRMMSDDPLVIGIGAPAFRVMAYIQPILGMAIVYVGALRGVGDTRFMFWLQVLGGIVLRAAGAYLFGVVLEGGLIGCWCGMWLDNICKFVGGWLRFRHGGWKRIEV